MERFWIPELWNRVTQNNVTLQDTNSKMFIEILPSWNIEFYFDLLTPSINFYFSTFEFHVESLTRWLNLLFSHFWVVNSKMKNKEFHFNLLIQKTKKTKSWFQIIVTRDFLIEMKYTIRNSLFENNIGI